MTVKQQVLEIIQDEIECIMNNFPFTHDDEVKIDKLRDIYNSINDIVKEQNDDVISMADAKDCSNCKHSNTCGRNYCDAVWERVCDIRDGKDCWTK